MQKKSKTYSAWSAMKSRCFNPNNDSYKDYGARSISVCDRWLAYENFLEDMGEAPFGLSLDRIENDGSYTPENCRWATNRQQSLNKRWNVRWTHDGRTQTINEWACEMGLHQVTLRLRVVRSGWSIEKAILTPRAPYSKRAITS